MCLLGIVQAITGPRDTIPREQSLLTVSWMWFGRKLKDVIASR